MTWETKRYVHSIMFWQKSVEKILKACIIEVQSILPKKTHDIDLLLKQARLDSSEIGVVNAKEITRAFMRTRYEDLSRQYYSDRKKVEPLVTQAQNIYQ